MSTARAPRAALVAALVLAGACGGGEDADGFRAVDLATGDERSVDDLRGTPTLLAGWATWCVPCERELPELEAALPDLEGARIRVVAVNVDAPAVDRGDVTAMLGRLAPSLESWRDADSTLLGAYDSFVMPFSVLLDADGDVLRTWNGTLDPDDVLETVRDVHSVSYVE